MSEIVRELLDSADGWDACGEKYAENSSLERRAAERLKRLEDALTKIARFLEDAPIECGICCCGDSMESHNGYTGHHPVDQASWAAASIAKDARAALEEKP